MNLHNTFEQANGRLELTKTDPLALFVTDGSVYRLPSHIQTPYGEADSTFVEEVTQFSDSNRRTIVDPGYFAIRSLGYVVRPGTFFAIGHVAKEDGSGWKKPRYALVTDADVMNRILSTLFTGQYPDNSIEPDQWVGLREEAHYSVQLRLG